MKTLKRTFDYVPPFPFVSRLRLIKSPVLWKNKQNIHGRFRPTFLSIRTLSRNNHSLVRSIDLHLIVALPLFILYRKLWSEDFTILSSLGNTRRIVKLDLLLNTFTVLLIGMINSSGSQSLLLLFSHTVRTNV